MVKNIETVIWDNGLISLSVIEKYELRNKYSNLSYIKVDDKLRDKLALKEENWWIKEKNTYLKFGDESWEYHLTDLEIIRANDSNCICEFEYIVPEDNNSIHTNRLVIDRVEAYFEKYKDSEDLPNHFYPFGITNEEFVSVARQMMSMVDNYLANVQTNDWSVYDKLYNEYYNELLSRFLKDCKRINKTSQNKALQFRKELKK